MVGADRVVALERGTEVYSGDAAGLFADVALVRRLGLGLPAAGELALALAERGRGLRPPAAHHGRAPRCAGRRDVSGRQAVGGAMPGVPRRSDAPDAAGMSLTCRSVSFSYEEARAPIPALRDVSFELPAGGSLALLGASGSGKSTLLQVVRGLDRARERRWCCSTESDPTAAGYAALQREVGLVFQAARAAAVRVHGARRRGLRPAPAGVAGGAR